MGLIIAPTLHLNIVLVLPNNTLPIPNTMTLPLQKATFLHIQLLPEIAKGRKQVVKSLIFFSGGMSDSL